MERVIIYGIGTTGCQIAKQQDIREGGDLQVVAFTDSNPLYWGTELFGIQIVPPDEIKSYDFDKVIVASLMSYEVIAKKCEFELGIPREKIDTSYVSDTTVTRDKFLHCFAQIVRDKGLSGNIAECGVCEGIFAAKINAAFPDKTIYLFDTFEGFDARDIAVEQQNAYSEYGAGHLAVTSEQLVRNRLPYPEKAVFRKGYFPESTQGVNDTFVFVNLDFDLYKPTLAGLEFFYPRMVHGGIILVHDFFNEGYKGVKPAVDEFCAANGIAYMPIADEISVAIIKY